MDLTLYQQYLNQYVREAITQSDGSVRGIAEQLHERDVRGLIVVHREEKKRALIDARRAFDDHRHWPLEIILSHLGVAQD
jgi:hypothetical protein